MIDIEKIAASVNLPPAFAKLLRKRPVVYAPAVPTGDEAAERFSSARMPLFLAHRCAQETMTTCSAATACIIINAMRSSHGLKSCTIDEILASNEDHSWPDSVANLQCKGVSLNNFSTLLDEATRALVPAPVKVAAYTMRSNTQVEHDTVRSLLRRMESDARVFVAVNFNQEALLQDGFDVGHMSVIGGYDTMHDHALIFDVDIRELQPYWIPFDILLRGLNTYDSDAKDYRGLITLEAS